MGNKMNWNDEPIAELALHMNDAQIGEVYGKTAGAVKEARRNRGIPSSWKHKHKDIDWDSQPLGEIPDHVLAATLGCSQQSVWGARRGRGIPSSRAQARKDKAK